MLDWQTKSLSRSAYSFFHQGTQEKGEKKVAKWTKNSSLHSEPVDVVGIENQDFGERKDEKSYSSTKA